MSSSEDDGDIPETSECDRLCKEFAEISGTDEVCAQFYLQDRKWDLQRSVNDFFEDRKNKGALRVNKKSKAEVVVVLDGSEKGLKAAATAVVAESVLCRGLKRRHTENLVGEPSNADPDILKLICWNMDGLNERNLSLRMKAVHKIILQEDADVVFIQEVVPEAAEFFKESLKNYICVFGDMEGYFVGTFVRKNKVQVNKLEVVKFENSRMMRHYVQLDACVGPHSLCLLNTHLESTAEGATERMAQLKRLIDRVMSIPSEVNVICGGDMNLRDKELSEVGGLPKSMHDVWAACGSRKEVAYTWDMMRNDNLTFPGKFKPRLRFDRVFLRPSKPPTLRAKHFGLVGLERLLPHRCFPSDHWGLLCHFVLLKPT